MLLRLLVALAGAILLLGCSPNAPILVVLILYTEEK
jgi:hypothetical protein